MKHKRKRIEFTTETIEKIIRRFDRLRNYILYSSNKINFVFINRIVNNNNSNANNEILKFCINNKNIDLKINENFIKLNNLLLRYISCDRFKIIIINAVKELNNNDIFEKNISYNELIPINNSNLTDEEIIGIFN